jgi:hypothetical protein
VPYVQWWLKLLWQDINICIAHLFCPPPAPDPGNFKFNSAGWLILFCLLSSRVYAESNHVVWSFGWRLTMGRKSDSDDSFTQLPGNGASITLSNEQFALLIQTKAKLGVTDKATSLLSSRKLKTLSWLYLLVLRSVAMLAEMLRFWPVMSSSTGPSMAQTPPSRRSFMRRCVQLLLASSRCPMLLSWLQMRSP